MTTNYKVLNTDGTSRNGGHANWSMPTQDDDGTWTPGDWMPEIAEIVPCKSGYHYCHGELELLEWLGPAIYIVEPGPVVVPDSDKHVTNTARLLRPVEAWDDRATRLFAADCAERVLHLYEQEYPDDSRPRDAIVAARAFANGEIDEEQLAAAQAAAWAAARAAATAAAWAAEREWQTERLRWYLDGGAA